MGNATITSYERRKKNGDFDKFFKGRGIDIGCGGHPIEVEGVTKHDKIFGNDAYNLKMYEDEYFDFVYSSHCLEHLEEPEKALLEWWRVLKKGGHLVVVVPEFTLYEKRIWPSMFNTDHKQTFTIHNVGPMVYYTLPGSQLLRLQINESGFNYEDSVTDQTTKGAQAEIEFIVRKVSDPFWADQ